MIQMKKQRYEALCSFSKVAYLSTNLLLHTVLDLAMLSF